VRVRSAGHHYLALALLIAGTPAVAQMEKPGTAPATGPDAPRPDPDAPPQSDEPIVPEAEFDAALPPLSGDLNAPLEPLPTEGGAPASATPAAPVAGTAPVAPVGPEDPQLAQPLTPLQSFDSQPIQTAADAKDEDLPDIRYELVVRGLDKIGLDDEFKSLSALKEGGGKAENATQVGARAREDEGLAVRLMKSLGYYDATAISSIEPIAEPQSNPERSGRLRVTVSATPGRLYTLGEITVQANATVPEGLVRRELPLRTGDPIEAARIQGAEANVSLKLPQQGYPFVKLGERDILLDDQTGGETGTGDYTLPVDTGPRSSFGVLRTEGDPVFQLEHLNVFPRFDKGDLYDTRKADDLREALVATGLFSSIGVQPVRTGQPGPDGTEQVDLLVRQTRGPARSLGVTAGYGTGQGVKLEGTWTHRNLFPPEGALIAGVVAGTQEQGVSGTFRRQNAGRRDRTVSLIASVNHSNYDAFDAQTITLAGRMSYDSTPIWQKPFTWAFGFEVTGTNESVYDFDAGERNRGTYLIAALPGQVLFDRSDDLLNPTKGFRLKLNLSPETSVRGAARPYVRAMVEATGYWPIGDSIVLAGRARAGSIAGIDRDDLAPSRRYYGGGGGSVRGYGFQRLGPFDPDGNPVGGRSLNEFALEARYRFGNFGIVPFIDAGNAYESVLPKGQDLKFGAGIGGRFYTNFGPMRVDIATPLNPRPGDGKVALYLSIGQAF
jgi:translocation and assembly module TamA